MMDREQKHGSEKRKILLTKLQKERKQISRMEKEL